MMQLDGYEIKIGDTLYDMQRGPVTVHTITAQNKAAAKNAAGMKVGFGEDGRRVGADNRMVYWHAPLVIVPPREHSGWVSVRTALEDMKTVALALMGGRAG